MPLQHAGLDLSQMAGLVSGDELEPSSPSVSFKPELYIFEGEDSRKNSEKKVSEYYLDGGFKYFLFSTLPGEMIQFD